MNKYSNVIICEAKNYDTWSNVKTIEQKETITNSNKRSAVSELIIRTLQESIKDIQNAKLKALRIAPRLLHKNND